MNARYLEEDLCGASSLQECHVNHTWHDLFLFLIISAVMFISQLQCDYANSNPMKHRVCGQRGGGPGKLLSVPTPNEIDLPPSISVGTGTEEAHHAGTRGVAYSPMNEVLVQMCPLCDG